MLIRINQFSMASFYFENTLKGEGEIILSSIIKNNLILVPI